MIPAINPWKGLQPYIDSEEDLRIHPFCGRENVVREMFDLIDNNIITTLYGKSGIGKTSLLSAGLFPKLRQEDYIPVYVRLGTDCLENESFAECITRKITNKTIELENHSAAKIAMPNNKSNDFLWAYFANHSFYTSNGDVKFPVIILDQFEEIFSIDSSAVKHLLLQLQELTSDKLLPDGNPFNVNFRIVISIREDDLYLLEDAIDSYYIPELKANRYRLKPLDNKEAIRVIEVRNNTNVSLCRDLFDEEQFSEISDSIIKIATGNETNGGINTQVLSLCCYLLYNKNKNAQIAIRLTDVEELRGNLLGTFYDEATKELTDNQRKIFEEHLVTENNRRLAWSRKAFLDVICNSKDNPQKESHLFNGEYAILRNITTHGEKCVELIHDMLASIVAERRLHRKNRERNLRRRLNKMNVLSPEGRRLIDNALEFDPNVDKLGSDDRYFLDYWMKFNNMVYSGIERRTGNLNVTTAMNVSLQRAFDDSQLQDATICLEFINNDGKRVYTSDGIYRVKVKYCDNKITEILFFDSVETLTDSNAITPVYINGGFCGIRIEYNGELEVKRTYLQWDGETYLPTITGDGYASVEFLDYNKYGNPTRTIYKDVQGKRCKHNNGNYGFKSEYDEDGFECRRIFINEYDEPTPIISGVVARDLGYDHETGFLSREVYLDSDYSPMRDIRGYCAAEFKRDNKGRIIEERYVNEQREPCTGTDGYAIEKIEYHDNVHGNYSISSFYDCDGNAMMHPDGYWKARVNYDSLDYPVGMVYLDDEQNPVYLAENECQEIQFVYDKRHWFVGFKIIGENGAHKMGCWFEYNSTFTHIQRMGYLAADNRKTQMPGVDAYALGIREDSETTDLPLLRVYWDENDRPVEIGTGYYAQRLWEEKNVDWFDESDRTTKELFYDLDGNPMADRFGVYGKRFEYDEKLLIKNEISLDDNGLDVNDKDGVCRIEQLYDSNGKEICHKFYDRDGNRCLNSEGLLMFRFEWTDDYHVKTSIYYNQAGMPSDRELGYAYIIEEMDCVFPSKVHRKYYKNAAQEIVVVEEGFYIAEYLYDKDGNIVEIRNIGPDGNLMKKQDGYAILRIEIISNEEGLIRKVLYLDEFGQLIIPNGLTYAMSIKCSDKEGRVKKEGIFDVDEKPVKYPDGTYGAIYEYGLNNSVIQYNINENGGITSDNDGIAKSLIEFDSKGQKIKEILYDINGNARITDDEDYGKKWRYSDTLDCRTEATESIDDNEELMINKWGYAVVERCYDKKCHLLSVSYYDEDLHPIKSIDNYHIANHEYSDDFSKKIISYYDTEGNPCENCDGVSQVVQEIDSNGRVISEHRFNQEDEMVPYDSTTYIVKKEYISDLESKEYYLDNQGNLCEDSDGVAIMHVRKDNNGRVVFQMRYNSHEIPQTDECGDCGEETIYYDAQQMRKCISLDSDGKPHVNKLGFVSQIVFQINNVTRRLFLDADDTPIANIYGEFGQEVERVDDVMTKTTSIDSDQNPMIPNNQGYATEVRTLDENGRTKRLCWLNPDGSPYVNLDGDSGVEFVYLEDNREITVFLNKLGNPHINNRGYAQRLIEFDESGNEKAVMWLDVDSMPIANMNGDYGIMVEHGNIPNCIIRAYLDKEGNPHKNSEGWTFRKEISLDGSNMEYHHYDINMIPVEDQDGDVAYRKEVDKEGVISIVSLDNNGNLRNNKRGFAKKVVALDDQERVVKERWYKEDGAPFVDSNGDYGVVTIYDDEMKARTVVFLDSDENPRCSKERPYYAIKAFKDERGRDIKLLYLDANLQPIKNIDGTYGKATEYQEDSLFSFVETNIDAMGMPCENASGYVKKYVREDNNGRPLLMAYTDAEDNILTDSLGDKASGFIYSSDRDIFIIDSLDADFNPHLNKLGYSREIRIRLSEDNFKSVYLDLQGNTVIPKKKSTGLKSYFQKLFEK